jgi:hypothetical protein
MSGFKWVEEPMIENPESNLEAKSELTLFN